MNNVSEKPNRLPFLDSEPWPPEDYAGKRGTDLEPKEPIDQKRLSDSMNRNPLNSVAVEIVDFTFGEMLEFVSDIINAKGEYQLPDKLILATILHTAAQNRLSGENTVVKGPDTEVVRAKPKNGKVKVKDEPETDTGASEPVSNTGK